MSTSHALKRAIVLPDLRVVYVPVPKAACTTLLWHMVEAAGLPRERFTESTSFEVVPALTVHDMDRWPDLHRVPDEDEDWLRTVSSDPEWLVFSVVRDPLPRVWSAWQSKLLLREPIFVWRFGDADWFPGEPSSADSLVEDFRRFVRALIAGAAPFEAHWRHQNELLQPSVFNYSHIGHVEALSETIALLTARGIPCERTGSSGRENRTPLPFHPCLIEGDLGVQLAELYAVDHNTFGYGRPSPEQVGSAEDFSDWLDRTQEMIPALKDVVQRNMRIGHLSEALQGRPDWAAPSTGTHPSS